MSWDYFFGLFEADGSFSIILTSDKRTSFGYRVRPEIQLSQKNKVILDQTKTLWQSAGITCQEKKSEGGSNRAPAIVSQGVANLRRFLEKFKESNLTFYSLQDIDYQIMSRLLDMMSHNFHNSEIGRKQVIDLKYWLHQPPLLPDSIIDAYKLYLPKTKIRFISLSNPKTHIQIPLANRLERSVWENRHGFSSDSSKNVCLEMINEIYGSYFDKTLNIIHLLNTEKQKKDFERKKKAL